MTVDIKGKIEIIKEEVEVLDLVEEYMGYDTRGCIEVLISEAEDNGGDDYELIADGYSRALQDSYGTVKEMIAYINDSKRISRKQLLSILEEIENTITNVI